MKISPSGQVVTCACVLKVVKNKSVPIKRMAWCNRFWKMAMIVKLSVDGIWSAILLVSRYRSLGYWTMYSSYGSALTRSVKNIEARKGA